MKKTIPTIIIIILIAILGFAFWKFTFRKMSYSGKWTDLEAYYGIQDEDDFPVIHQDALSDMHARRFDGAYYMKLEDVAAHMTKRFYFGKADGKVYYCLPDDRIVLVPGETAWTTDGGQKGQEEAAPAVLDGETLWLSLDFVKNYANFSYSAFTEPNRLVLTTAWEEETVAEVKDSTMVRITGGIKSEIAGEAKSGTTVRILEPMDTWSGIMTEDGVFGYVENDTLGEPYTRQPEPVETYTEPDYKTRSLDKKINMVWHNVAVVEGNDTIGGLFANVKGVNILSPTWFYVSDENGDVKNIIYKENIDLMHGRGIQVWALFDNFPSGQSYTDFLTTDAGRSTAISQVVAACEEYGIDGINVDIENITPERGGDFIEFIRELCIAAHKKNLYVSVDNYVPYNFNDYYHLDEQGRFADYIVLMGYDEHYAGSQEAGSVASIDYVTYGIGEALKEVPKDKLINAIPFYTRIWTTSPEGVSSQAVTMAYCQEFMQQHGMKPEWSDSFGQYYAEAREGDNYYQIWVEGKKSIELKLRVMEEYGLAGVAEWCLGFETPEIWDVIEAYMKQ